MRKIGEGRSVSGQRGTCATCGARALDPASRDLFRAYYCGAHSSEAAQKEQARLDDARRAEREAPRLLIQEKVLDTTPRLYRDVIELAEGGWSPEAEAAVMERLNCINPPAMVQAAKEAAGFLLTTPGAIVVFAGLTGTGKTTLMATVLAMIVAAVPPLGFHENPLFRSGALFGEEWTHDEPEPFVLWKTAKKLFEAAKQDKPDVALCEDVALLALDDIGAEGVQQNLTPVSDVVWGRYDAFRPSVITTGFIDPIINPVPPDRLTDFLHPLAARYGNAFVRRIAEPKAKRIRVIPLLA